MADDPTKGPLTKEELQRQAAAKKLLEGAPLGSWAVAVADIPQKGFQRERKASEEERSKIAQALGLKSVDDLTANYRIHGLAGGGWRLSGSVKAKVVQSCVITLEPVQGSVDDDFAVEFWRDMDEPEGGEDKTVLDGADVEPLEGDIIPAGRIVFETLSAGLNPYPRKDGASLEWQDKNAAEGGNANPFSVLARLKDKS